MKSIQTSADSQDITLLLSRIDSFLNTPFDSFRGDNDDLSMRRGQIDTYIENLEEIQSDYIEKIQHKLGLAFTAGLRPTSARHKTDMRAISSRICTLNSLLNELAPISRLPIEVLHLIIVFQASQFIEPFRLSLISKAPLPPDLLERVRLTHVCRKWRKVALSNPVLWSQISPDQPKWALEMLARSGNVPLSITADYFNLPQRNQEVSRKLLRQMSRIRELSLCIPEPGVLDAELVQPAPNLESFTIKVYRELRPQELAQPLFQGVAPKLRHMSLEKCEIPWDSHLFNGLTVLRLADLNLHHDLTPSQFLDVFRRIPNLRALRIIDVEFDFRNIVNPPSSRLVLRNLNFLTLSGSASTCRFFLKYLDLPRNPTIYLAFNLRREQIEQTPISIADSFAQHLTGMERPLRHLSIEGISKSFLRLEGSLTEYNNQQEPPQSHFTFRVSTDLYQAMYQLISELPSAFLSCLSPAGQLRSLLLKGWGACTACRSGVAGLSSVTSIILHGRAADEWLAHMNSSAGDGALPSLRSISFQDAVFKQDESPLYHMLVAFLRSERKGCARIEVLEFRKCVGLEPEQISRLQRRVIEFSLSESTQWLMPTNLGQTYLANTNPDPNRIMVSQVR
ncbi:hypothetical protein BDZ94DRAFT_594341 [Collybia nuda]|uniref:F-box domain-containing protein n=1 Tax=Collybia nuda TaxID=64659 RepID=A0A9P6CKA2_9AGAR|nr:hypothetical protein BDZ94DRAFT_594341 [Collybia nuda]